jgi:flagellar FliJ protein
MAHTTTTTWERLKELAQQRADVCAARLAEFTRSALDAQRKLEMLREYRREYAARLASASRDGIHGDGLRNYRSFIANLDRAIEQQGQIVAQANGDRERARLQWSAEQRNVESYRVLKDRAVMAVQRAERRQQQKQQDEFANRTLPRFLTGAD